MRPSWASKPECVFESQGGQSGFTLTFSQKPVWTGYKVLIEAYFPQDEGKPGMFNRKSVAAVVSGFTYHSTPKLAAGQAAVVEESSYIQLAAAEFFWKENKFTLHYPGSAVEEKQPNYIRMFIVPETFDMNLVRGASLNGIAPVPLFETDPVTRRPIEPWVPEGLPDRE